jgi:hypothetical protein
MAAKTAAQRKKEQRRRVKDAGLKTWSVSIDVATRDSLKRLTAAYGTGSQEKTFLVLIGDALDRLNTSSEQSEISAELPSNPGLSI